MWTLFMFGESTNANWSFNGNLVELAFHVLSESIYNVEYQFIEFSRKAFFLWYENLNKKTVI